MPGSVGWQGESGSLGKKETVSVRGTECECGCERRVQARDWLCFSDEAGGGICKLEFPLVLEKVGILDLLYV